MSLLRCVYVSTACLERRQAPALAQAIVDHAVTANQAAQITGALMFDGSRFAQYLEGSKEEITKLVNRIVSDNRHKDLVFIEKKRVAERLFNGFSMAYSGNSVFVGHSIARSLDSRPEEADVALQKLIRLMLEFAR